MYFRAPSLSFPLLSSWVGKGLLSYNRLRTEFQASLSLCVCMGGWGGIEAEGPGVPSHPATQCKQEELGFMRPGFKEKQSAVNKIKNE